MRGTVVLVAALCLALGVVLGRAWPSGESAPPAYLAQLKEALDLSSEQVDAVARLLEDQDRDLRAMVVDSQRELQDPVAERRQRFLDDMFALLDDDQRQRYESLTVAEQAEPR